MTQAPSPTVGSTPSRGEVDGPPMIAALTGIRGFAALAPVLYHFRDVLYALLPSTFALDPLLRQGYLGVDVFFILSGFVLSYNYADRMRVLDGGRCRTFFVARFARVWPVHAVTTLLAVALIVGLEAAGGTLNPYQGRTIPGLIGNFFLLQAAPIYGFVGWNPASWSISSEAAAYLAFPLLALIIARLRWRAALLLAVGVSLLQLAVIHALSGLQWWNGFYGPRIAGEFTLGCLLWALWRGRMHRGRRWDVVALGSLAVAIGLMWFNLVWYAVPFLGLTVAATSTSASIVHRVLGSRVMQWAGRVSYSLYLAYIPVIVILWTVLPPVHYAFEPHVVRLAVVAAYFIAMVVAAAALYYGVEEPARNWIRSRAGGRKTLARTTPAEGAEVDGVDPGHVAATSGPATTRVP